MNQSNGFCNSHMNIAMYMGGFQGFPSSSSGCLVFLFDGWVLDSAFLYFLAMLASVALGFASERLRHFRSTHKTGKSRKSMALTSLLYSVSDVNQQLTLSRPN